MHRARTFRRQAGKVSINCRGRRLLKDKGGMGEKACGWRHARSALARTSQGPTWSLH